MAKGCYNCMRVLLVIMNVIFLLIGIALLGLSVWLYLDSTVGSMKTSYGMAWQVDIVLFAAMAIGGVTIVISAFGCCGAYHESPCQLGAYLTCLILIAAIEVAGAVYLYMNWSNSLVRDSLSQAITASIKNSTGGPDSVPGHIVKLQTSLRCCGANGSSDYEAATAAALCKTANGTLYSDGCVNKSIQVMNAYSLWIFIAVVSVAVLELIVMLLSVWLCCVARRTEYSTVNTNA